ncbi:MAG: hypothetical protein H0X51_07395 [Parachlamydiaceae bacterium]|nr:hypothetical protein [Parachlamydiaceae bacterium]
MSCIVSCVSCCLRECYVAFCESDAAKASRIQREDELVARAAAVAAAALRREPSSPSSSSHSGQMADSEAEREYEERKVKAEEYSPQIGGRSLEDFRAAIPGMVLAEEASSESGGAGSAAAPASAPAAESTTVVVHSTALQILQERTSPKAESKS